MNKKIHDVQMVKTDDDTYLYLNVDGQSAAKPGFERQNECISNAYVEQGTVGAGWPLCSSLPDPVSTYCPGNNH